jgi:MOSC domain-containing protein YiiM
MVLVKGKGQYLFSFRVLFYLEQKKGIPIMWQGRVVSLQITTTENAPMIPIQEAHAVPSRGIEGDRYYLGTGHFSKQGKESYEITLIETEALEGLRREYGCEISPLNARRNIATIGVPLNHLVWKEFYVGEVKLLGRRLCEPCFHLTTLTDALALGGLLHRGGLRAQILTEGIIRLGDTIRLSESQEQARTIHQAQAEKVAQEAANEL